MGEQDMGVAPSSRGRSGGPSDPSHSSVSRPTAPAANADADPYWDYDDSECWNCGGDGFVYGCSWDWQCDTYDAGEGSCLCTRPCHICHPPKPTTESEALKAILASAIEAAQADATAQTGAAEGESAAGEARDAHV